MRCSSGAVLVRRCLACTQLSQQWLQCCCCQPRLACFWFPLPRCRPHMGLVQSPHSRCMRISHLVGTEARRRSFAARRPPRGSTTLCCLPLGPSASRYGAAVAVVAIVDDVSCVRACRCWRLWGRGLRVSCPRVMCAARPAHPACRGFNHPTDSLAPWHDCKRCNR